jgi:hypothetical protein
MATKFPNGHQIFTYVPISHGNNIVHTPTFSIPSSPKYTQIGIFGLKIYHLATLKLTRNDMTRKKNNCKTGKWDGNEHDVSCLVRRRRRKKTKQRITDVRSFGSGENLRLNMY